MTHLINFEIPWNNGLILPTFRTWSFVSIPAVQLAAAMRQTSRNKEDYSKAECRLVSANILVSVTNFGWPFENACGAKT